MMINLSYYPLIQSILMLIRESNSQPVVGTLTIDQKQYLLDMHNNIRNVVAGGAYLDLPSASNMNELLWVCLSEFPLNSQSLIQQRYHFIHK